MLTPLEIIGVIAIVLILFCVVKSLIFFIFHYFIASTCCPAINLKSLGQWAVITGCTDGIGKAYANALARRGLDIVLISRSATKLQEEALEIGNKYGVNTQILPVDFSSGLDDIYKDIERHLEGLQIAILINNVGASYPHPDYYLELPDKDEVYNNIIKVNIYSVTYMTKIVLPKMVERNKGVIVNISSTAACIPSPLLTVYSASKAYVEKFSEDLAYEYSKHGVIIQCLVPGYVATKMSKIRNATWMSPSPKEYAEAAVRSIGVQRITPAYYPHSLQITVINFMKKIFPTFTIWIIRYTMENVKKSAIRNNIEEI